MNDILIILLPLIPFIGGLISWLPISHLFSRAISMLSLLITSLVLTYLFLETNFLASNAFTPIIFKTVWVKDFGLQFYLSMDALSFVLVSLTLILGFMAVLCSWREITYKVGFFHANILFAISGILGVFLAYDMLLFYLFWEVMLIPMTFLIAIWGHEKRTYAAIKFFIFTQVGGLLMLVSILAMYFVKGYENQSFSFAYETFLNFSTSFSSKEFSIVSLLVMFGFFIAFAIKLPALPFHTWLPDAHTEAPTAGSVILAGLLLKTGGYGLIRFVVPFFPDISSEYSLIFMGLGAAGIVYGAILALAQTDLKKLVAYTSVSHMGFVLIGVFSFKIWGYHGSVLQMLCHGISTSALFMIVGSLYRRYHTRDISRLGQVFTITPKLGGIGIFFLLASFGLPGLGNFIAEVLSLYGAFNANIYIACISSLALILSAIYSLTVIKKVFFSAPRIQARIQEGQSSAVFDLDFIETLSFSILIFVIAALGVFPAPIINMLTPMVMP